MSAITATYRMDGKGLDAEGTRAMLTSMAHRAPDARSVWQSGPIALGHGMLFTTPESLSEKLPLNDPDGHCTITADARIDNRDELISQLRLSPRGTSYADSELILAAYEMWGEDCVDHLLGDYVFAIWDAERHKLFCARDHFGVRPFYYFYTPGRLFVCASEIKALLTQEDVPNRLNEKRLGDYLEGVSGDAISTIYDGIRRLQAGHALSIDADGLRIRKYYELKPSDDVGADWTDEAYAERFRDLFEEAVRCRTRSAFPVGSELSGGLDSSYVTCVARDLLQEDDRGPLHTISGIFEKVQECDERTYIQAVVDQGGVEPLLVAIDDEGPLTRIDDVYEVLDDGIVGNNHQISWAMRAAARDAGVRVLLDGHDGDYTVGHGRSYLRSLALEGRWDEFIAQVRRTAQLHERADHRQPQEELLSSPGAMLRAYALRDLDELAESGKWIPVLKASAKLARLTDLSASFYLKRYLRKLIVPRSLHALKRKMRARTSSSAPSLLDGSFAERMGLNRRRHYASDGAEGREEQRRLLSSHGFALGLEIADHYAAAHGIELRHPFLDKRLVEFCLALPLDQSFRNGWTRWVMRTCMESTAPHEVSWRVGKANLRPAFKYGLLQRDVERLRQVLRPGNMLDGYVDKHRAQQLLDRREDLGIEDLVSLGRAATVSALLESKFGPKKSSGTELSLLKIKAARKNGAASAALAS